jgi:hypothetical protein
MKKILSSLEIQNIFSILKNRFDKTNFIGNKNLWVEIEHKLKNNLDKLWSINEMEKTGGEPNVIEYITKTNEFLFCDCSVESPKERRSLCYDDQGTKFKKAIQTFK